MVMNPLYMVIRPYLIKKSISKLALGVAMLYYFPIFEGITLFGFKANICVESEGHSQHY